MTEKTLNKNMKYIKISNYTLINPGWFKKAIKRAEERLKEKLGIKTVGSKYAEDVIDKIWKEEFGEKLI